MSTDNYAFLKNRVDILEKDMSTLRIDMQKFLNSAEKIYLRKSAFNNDQVSQTSQFSDLQRQIRDISERVQNVLLPNETRAYLSVKEINTIKSGHAEVQARITELNNLVVTFMSLISRLEADWGSSKVNFNG